MTLADAVLFTRGEQPCQSAAGRGLGGSWRSPETSQRQSRGHPVLTRIGSRTMRAATVFMCPQWYGVPSSLVSTSASKGASISGSTGPSPLGPASSRPPLARQRPPALATLALEEYRCNFVEPPQGVVVRLCHNGSWPGRFLFAGRGPAGHIGRPEP